MPAAERPGRPRCQPAMTAHACRRYAEQGNTLLTGCFSASAAQVGILLRLARLSTAWRACGPLGLPAVPPRWWRSAATGARTVPLIPDVDRACCCCGGNGRADADAVAEPADTPLDGLIGSCWDIGLEIGRQRAHRDQMRNESSGDVTVQTALLESRGGAAERKPACLRDLPPRRLRGDGPRPFLRPRRWRCASATRSTRTRPTLLSPTAKEPRRPARPAARHLGGRPAWAELGRTGPPRA